MKRKSLLFVLVLVMGMLTACKSEAKEKVVEATQAVSTAIPIVQVTPSSTEEFTFAQDWHVCTTIQQGEWAYSALRRAGGGEEPHERKNSVFMQQIEILHIARDGEEAWIEVFDWTSFLELNPATWPGDRICDTIMPRLQLEMEPLEENIHKSVFSTVTPAP